MHSRGEQGPGGILSPRAGTGVWTVERTREQELRRPVSESQGTTPNLESILLSADAIECRVTELALQISVAHTDPLHLIVVLRGAVVFAADLIRKMTVPVTVDFITLSSYGGGTESNGEVIIQCDCGDPLAGKRVLIVEDVVDTGRSLLHLRNHLQCKGAEAIETCVLLDKPGRRQVSVPVEYIGFSIPDVFVVGYGMDYDGHYRQLPHIAVLRV